MKLHQINDRVHIVTGTNVNWALISEGRDLTVVDAGYPNDGSALLESIAAIGHRVQDVQAVILTHAHLDHFGGVPTLLAEHDVPVLTGVTEVSHAHRNYLEQITPVQMARLCAHRNGIVWVAQTLKAVVPHINMAVNQASAVEDGVPLDIPGRPVPVATPGHTSGHTAYLLEEDGVLFSGDALVTDHPLLDGPPRPQLLPGFFSEDDDQCLESIRTLAGLPADLLVPGHGPEMYGEIAELVDTQKWT